MEQQILLVRVYCGTNSLKRVNEAFETNFPNTSVPAETTIIRLVNKFFATGRPKTGTTTERVEEVHALAEQTPQTSYRCLALIFINNIIFLFVCCYVSNLCYNCPTLYKG